MTDVINERPFENDDETHNFTQGIRKKIVLAMMPAGNIPNDPDNIKLIAGLLTDIDRTTLGRAKIKSDENIANTQMLTEVVTATLLKVDPNKIFGEHTRVEREIPMISVDQIPDPILVEGELDEQSEPISYDAFMERFEE
jgi:hypothetical protein